MNGVSEVAVASKTKNGLLSAVQCVSLIQSYIVPRSLTKLKQLHAHIITSGLLYFSSYYHSVHLRSNLLSTYALCGSEANARKLFDELPKPSLFLYNAMIRMYSQSGSSVEAVKLFIRMLSSVPFRANKFTYPFVIKACRDLSWLKVGVLVYGKAIRSGHGRDMFVLNSLLAMYMNCGKTEAARWVFDTMRERTVVAWNTMISGYVKNGFANEALVIFNQMVDLDVELDSATIVSLLPACGELKELALGRKLHAVVEEKGLGDSISVWNSLIDMYTKCGCMDEARVIFGNMTERDVVTWTVTINGYILNGDERSAFGLWRPMQLEGIKPNTVTIASLISACANLQELKRGMCFHGWAVRQKLEDDVIVKTALIDMYAKCNWLGLSFRLFTRTPENQTGPWNAILSGCMHNGLATGTIKNFKQMLYKKVDPDGATFNILLTAYVTLADLEQAYNIHGYLIRTGFLSINEVATGLVDLYSKCGSLESAHEIFNGIAVRCRDIILWSVLIAGYGNNGDGEAAVSVFKQMVQFGVKPNEVTFTSVLHACSHAGLVDLGLDLFKLMLKEHQSLPCTDHYTCMVDLLGRVGRLQEAYELISTMRFQSNHAVWGALLGACVIHENVALGVVAARRLFELEPENTGNYVLLAKIYAAVGRWGDAENIRSMINDIGLRKTPAHSSIEVRDTCKGMLQ
ncbi:hypothetical protein Nepgr_006018 [Nepenthes gracilis]|uniref:Pentatricopeptide repeat-containing protein n=1 Tax=Nepenthes gracilis TaxID=150966 RepID=A0AAD3S4M3_NEPGR|nr:hypothetical protein Nepgr_006018 [Nepenthes gracilis]